MISSVGTPVIDDAQSGVGSFAKGCPGGWFEQVPGGLDGSEYWRAPYFDVDRAPNGLRLARPACCETNHQSAVTKVGEP